MVAAHLAKGIGEGLSSKIRFYNSRVVSKLSHVMQLQWRPHSAHAVEDRALSIVCAMPYRAIPSPTLAVLKRFGAVTSVKRIDDLNLATLCRVASRTSKFLSQSLDLLREAWSDEAAGWPVVAKWASSVVHFDSGPMAFNLQGALEAAWLPSDCRGLAARAIAQVLSDSINVLEVQSKFHSALVELGTEAGVDALHVRVLKWYKKFGVGSLETEASKGILSDACALLKSCAPCVSAAVMKVWCNAVCTKGRFQDPDAKCMFGCEAEDKIFHYIRCPLLLLQLLFRCPLDTSSWQGICFVGLAPGAPSVMTKAAFMHMYSTVRVVERAGHNNSSSISIDAVADGYQEAWNHANSLVQGARFNKKAAADKKPKYHVPIVQLTRSE